MLQFLPVFGNNTIAIRASGKLTHKDYQDFLPQLEAQIRNQEKVSVLFELDNFSGWELKAAKDDFNFGMEHLDDFERLAVVGDKAWEKWMTLMAKPFLPSGAVRYFNRENLQVAWDWLREKQNLEELAGHITPYQSIVMAVDYSLYALYAARRAVELADLYQASLSFINVVPEIAAYSYYDDALSDFGGSTPIIDPQQLSELNQLQMDHSAIQMKKFVKELDSGLPVKTEILNGECDSTLVSYLEAQCTDLVIFGARKKQGFNKLLGSIPHYVQSHARCDTLVVPVQESAF